MKLHIFNSYLITAFKILARKHVSFSCFEFTFVFIS